MSKRRTRARAALELKKQAQDQFPIGTVKIFVGLPGTGKSTEAKKYHDYIVISRDLIRAQRQIIVDPNRKAVGGAEEEVKVFNTEVNQLKQAVLQGKNVIIDDTNLKATTRSFFLGVIKAINPNYKVEIVFFKESSLEDCIKRRSEIPLKAIRNMAIMGDWTPKETSPWSVQYDKVTYMGDRDYVKEGSKWSLRWKVFVNKYFKK